ncbi:unnamed protein product [Durusdinium trenchii]|uniref:Translation initiation factor IF2/IF5 domain-containing protein n=1 Tax=Durusdinium trenchii TaxID=1381693 RepID=A0ABP0LS56_9DINO
MERERERVLKRPHPRRSQILSARFSCPRLVYALEVVFLRPAEDTAFLRGLNSKDMQGHSSRFQFVAMSMVNIPSTNTDPQYRNKMPRLQAKIEGRGNGIKTCIVNTGEVPRAIKRPPQYVTKFFDR